MGFHGSAQGLEKRQISVIEQPGKGGPFGGRF
jgi:hypothetical protein